MQENHNPNGIEFDDEVILPHRDKKKKNDILPFFKALSEMRKLGLLDDEAEGFKRDMEFEKLLESDDLDEDFIVEKYTHSLNKYMEYFNSILFNMSDDKLKKLAAVVEKQSQEVKRINKKKKPRWRDVRK